MSVLITPSRSGGRVSGGAPGAVVDLDKLAGELARMYRELSALAEAYPADEPLPPHAAATKRRLTEAARKLQTAIDRCRDGRPTR